MTSGRPCFENCHTSLSGGSRRRGLSSHEDPVILPFMATGSDSCGGSTNCSFTVTVNSITNSQSNLQVTKTASTNSVAVGDYVSFYITVTNLGLTTSSNITVRDLLPPGFTFSASSTVCGSVYNPVTGLVTNTRSEE